MALPPTAVVDATLEDASRADAPAETIDVTGKRAATFTARAQASLPSTTPGLKGTVWHLPQI